MRLSREHGRIRNSTGAVVHRPVVGSLITLNSITS